MLLRWSQSAINPLGTPEQQQIVQRTPQVVTELLHTAVVSD